MIRTCRICGKAGTDLVGNYYYIGGMGDVMVYECRDCLKKRLEESQSKPEVESC